MRKYHALLILYTIILSENKNDRVFIVFKYICLFSYNWNVHRTYVTRQISIFTRRIDFPGKDTSPFKPTFPKQRTPMYVRMYTFSSETKVYTNARYVYIRTHA